MTTDGSIGGVSSSLEEPAELGVNAIHPLRENVEDVTVADLGEEVGVPSIRGRAEKRLGGGPEKMG